MLWESRQNSIHVVGHCPFCDCKTCPYMKNVSMKQFVSITFVYWISFKRMLLFINKQQKAFVWQKLHTELYLLKPRMSLPLLTSVIQQNTIHRNHKAHMSNSYKAPWIPWGFRDFETPCPLSHFHFDNRGHLVFLQIIVIIHAIMHSMEGITVMRDSRPQRGEGHERPPASSNSLFIQTVWKLFLIPGPQSTTSIILTLGKLYGFGESFKNELQTYIFYKWSSKGDIYSNFTMKWCRIELIPFSRNSCEDNMTCLFVIAHCWKWCSVFLSRTLTV